MTATHEEIQQDQTGTDSKLSFRCGHCGATYDNELLTRIHIIRSEDNAHLNLTDTMEETKIEALNEDGDVVEEIDPMKNNVNFQSLEVDDLPDDLNERHKRIVLAGAYNPYEDNYSKITDEADDLLEADGYDTLSYSTVRRVVREFFRPQEEGNDPQATEGDEEGTAKEQTLADLTPKQQTILISKYLHPEESKSQWAKRADGAAKSYPGQVEKKAVGVDERLEQKIEQEGKSPVQAILEDLKIEDIEELQAQAATEEFDPDMEREDCNGLYIDIDFESVLEAAREEGDADVFDLGVDEQQKAMSASPFDDSGTDAEPAEAETTETWGSADSATTTSTAQSTEGEAGGQQSLAEAGEPDTTDSPETTTSPGEAEAEPEVASEETETESVAEETAAEAETADQPATTGETVPRQKVESLLDKVNFARRVTEKEGQAEQDDRQAVLEEVEDEIESILSGN